ncbi:MAG: c-type cytochrome [Sedimenticolaceae bacterium]
MIKSTSVIALVSGLALSQSVTADQALAQANGCMACHQVETKLVGPSYKDVAAKYRGGADAKATLIGKVRSGGAGIWGEVPMPPNLAISDADLDAVMVWVLSH